MRRYALRDDQWERIKDLLPGREGHVGVTAKDNRRFVEAVLYRYRAGIPWRDLPERFGDPIKVHTRFSRWARSGVWEKVFKVLAADDRYRDSDRALYPELERLMHDEYLSHTAAAMSLATADRVAGVGSTESRAKRLGLRYERDRNEQN